MIKNYSVEAATPEGKPTGKFFFNKGAALQGAHEIIKTHLGLEGEKAL